MAASRAGSFAHLPPWDNQGAEGKGSLCPSRTVAQIKKTGNCSYKRLTMSFHAFA